MKQFDQCFPHLQKTQNPIHVDAAEKAIPFAKVSKFESGVGAFMAGVKSDIQKSVLPVEMFNLSSTPANLQYPAW